ncbi:uncharacterized protein LOC143254989 [Tachypleus tridentatus]|uniref:uncharacterized protein LOC143254989 n=1 Tax=Tachypleus tridentatus TaxID=6853 RepID=UPI003FD5B17F
MFSHVNLLQNSRITRSIKQQKTNFNCYQRTIYKESFEIAPYSLLLFGGWNFPSQETMRFATTPFLGLVPVILVLSLITDVGYCGTNWLIFTRCITEKMGVSAITDSDVRCAGIEMFKSYWKMSTIKCINCDKYFHCQGNYNAVYKCGRKSQSIRTAEVISDCREFSQGGTDSGADQAANRYGRNGGNCAAKYLCDVNCKYNPNDDTCLSSNC